MYKWKKINFFFFNLTFYVVFFTLSFDRGRVDSIHYFLRVKTIEKKIC